MFYLDTGFGPVAHRVRDGYSRTLCGRWLLGWLADELPPGRRPCKRCEARFAKIG